MFKNQKGITLVALVITIIVLLILAGTAITLTINQGNLFNKANEATTKWNAAVQDENDKLTELQTELDKHTAPAEPTE